MAEVTAQSLYDQLSPMAKRYYDQQFKNQYTPGKENILLSSQPEYEQMKAVFEAEQQVPEKGLLDSLNFFSTASAAEPDKISSVSTTPGFQTILNPDGTIEIVPVDTSSNLNFKSMADMAAANANLNLFPAPQDLYTGAIANNPTYQMKQQLGMVPTGITAASAAVPFGTPEDRAQGFVKGSPSDASFPGANFQFLESATEDEQDKVKEKSGIAKLFEFLGQFSPVKFLSEGIGSLINFKDSPRYMPATMSVYGYTPAELNRMNALGGYYSEPMRAYRRQTNRISKMLERAAAGKKISQKNLDRLMTQAGMGDVDTGAMIESIKESAQTGYGGYGSREAAKAAAATGARDYSRSPGAMAGDMEYGEE